MLKTLQKLAAGVLGVIFAAVVITFLILGCWYFGRSVADKIFGHEEWYIRSGHPGSMTGILTALSVLAFYLVVVAVKAALRKLIYGSRKN
jgi:hypothetical protein